MENALYVDLQPLVNRSSYALYYNTMDVLMVEEVLLFDFNTIVAAIGGSMGLFLGFSCLQLAKDGYHIMARIVAKFRQKK